MIGGIALAVYVGMQNAELETVAGALLIIGAALLPGYLWSIGLVTGLPIFPVFAFTFTWTHGLPLVTAHPTVREYTPSEHLNAALIVAGFLLLANLIWLLVVMLPSTPPKKFLELPPERANRFFLAGLLSAVLYEYSLLNGLLEPIPAPMTPVIRAGVTSLAVYSIFWFCTRIGRGDASLKIKISFLFLFVPYVALSLSTFFLVNGLSVCLFALICYLVSSRRIPWIMITAMLATSAILQLGKGPMRVKYWENPPSRALPTDYITIYSEWFDHGIAQLMHQTNMSVSQFEVEETKADTLIERASLIHMLLLVKKKIESGAPQLDGASYSSIHLLLIPSIFWRDRPSIHTPTALMSHWSGLQKPGGAGGANIGWGLLAESFANFGLYGALLLAVVLGIFYGVASRWTMYTPSLSARTLFAVLVVTNAIQSEIIAAVWCSTLFQGTAILLGIAAVFMRWNRMERTTPA